MSPSNIILNDLPMRSFRCPLVHRKLRKNEITIPRTIMRLNSQFHRRYINVYTIITSQSPAWAMMRFTGEFFKVYRT